MFWPALVFFRSPIRSISRAVCYGSCETTTRQAWATDRNRGLLGLAESVPLRFKWKNGAYWYMYADLSAVVSSTWFSPIRMNVSLYHYLSVGWRICQWRHLKTTGHTSRAAGDLRESQACCATRLGHMQGIGYCSTKPL